MPPDASARRSRRFARRSRERLAPAGDSRAVLSTRPSDRPTTSRAAARGGRRRRGRGRRRGQQTAGRGRRGHTWFSPPGSGLYVSVVLMPARARVDPMRATTLLTLAAGVALAEAVEAATGLRVDIKWPNDLLVGRRKLAGILAEASGRGDRRRRGRPRLRHQHQRGGVSAGACRSRDVARVGARTRRSIARRARRDAGRAGARATTICSTGGSMLFSTRGAGVRRRPRRARDVDDAAGPQSRHHRGHRRQRCAARAGRRSRRAHRRRRGAWI